MLDSEALRTFGDAVGIMPEYRSVGGSVRWTSDDTYVRILHVMGFDVADANACQRLLADFHRSSSVDGNFKADTPEVATAGSDSSMVSGGAVRRCCHWDQAAKQSRLFGLSVNLYAVRAACDWGIGDFQCLRRLIEWGAGLGASVVGLNPLYFCWNEGSAISPYSPVSRLFLNYIYLSVPEVPEYAQGTHARSLIDSDAFAADIATLQKAAKVDWSRVARTKLKCLKLLHEEFWRQRDAAPTGRLEAYRDFLANGDGELISFATFLAMSDAQSTDQTRLPWTDWPSDWRTCGSQAAKDFAKSHAKEIDFWMYLQFEADRQLEQCARRAGELGMPIGLCADLPVGVPSDSYDCWRHPSLYVGEVSVGAPPDELGPQGQVWGLAPLNPLKLNQGGMDVWRAMLERAMKHAGAVRIDHIMGLARQYWVPRGVDGSQGAYVRYPCHALLDVLGELSAERRVVVIGEDLGTVPDGFEDLLKDRHILSTRVLYFEREGDGTLRHYGLLSDRAVLTINTHDMVPLAGFEKGVDRHCRKMCGEVDSADALNRKLDQRAQDAKGFRRGLQRSECLTDALEPHASSLLHAAIRHMAKSSAPLVLVSLEDLMEQEQPVNLPGVVPDLYPSWSIRHRLSLETLEASAFARTAMDLLGERRFNI